VASTEVLELLLAARYIGRPAFQSFSSDIEGIVSQSNALTRVGSAFNALGELMIVAGAGVAIGLGVAVKQAASYQQSLTRIQSVTGYTNDQMNQLSDTIMNISDTYGQSSQTIADASYLVLSHMGALGAGFQDVMHAQILPAIGAFVEASGAGKTGSVGWIQAANDTVHVLTGMHQPLMSWQTDLGIMTEAENKSGLTQQQMTAAFTRFMPLAGMLGMNFGQSTDLIAAVASSGVFGAKEGTELSSGLRMAFTGKHEQELANLIGDPSRFFQNGQFSDFGGFVNVLTAKLDQIKDPIQRMQEAQTIFGAVGGKTFMEFLTPKGGGPGALQLFNTLEGQRKATGDPVAYMLKVAFAQAQGPQAKFQILQAALQNLAIVVGTALLPVVMNLVLWLTNAVTGLRHFAEAHPQALKHIAEVAPLALLGGGVGAKMLGAGFNFLGKQASEGVGTVAGAMAHNVGGFFGRAGGAGMAFGQNILGAPFNLFKPGLDRELLDTQLRGPGGKFGAKITEDMVKGKGLHFMDNLLPKFDEIGGFPGLAKAGGRKLAAPVVKLGDMGANALEGFDKIGGFPGILQKLVGFIPTLIPMLGGLAAGFMAIIVPILLIAGFIAIVILTFTRFRHEAEQTGLIIGKQLQPIFRAFALIVMGAWKMIQDAWNKAQPAINHAMMQLFTDLPKIVPLLKAIGVVIGVVVFVIAELIVGLVNGFLHALPFIIGFFSKIISFIGDFVQFVIDLFTNWKAIPKDIQNLLSDIWGLVTNFFGMIGNFIWGFVQGVVDFFKWLWDKLTGHSVIPDMINDIFQWFLKLPGQIPGMITNLINSLVNLLLGAAVTLLSKAEALGKNIMQGIANGIGKMAGAVKDALGGAAGGAIDWFKNKLGIKSPSTVFFEHGVNTMMGYILGIQSQQKKIQQAMTSIGSTAIGASTQGTGAFHLASIHVDSIHGLEHLNRPERQRSSTYQHTRSIQYERMNGRSNIQPVTRENLMNQLDMQYRFAYQRTA